AGVRGAGRRGVGVDDAVAVGGVGDRAHGRFGAGGLLEDLLQLVHAQSRVGGEHEGRDAADVRRGHRGAGDRVVVLPGVAGPGRVDLCAGGADLRLDVFHAVPGDRAAAGEGGDVVVDVRRSDTDGVRVAAGEPDGAAGRAVVAVGEHRHDARRAPGGHGVPERAAGAGAAAPRVAGDVRGLGRVATGGEDPLHAGQDADLTAAATVGEDLDADPLRVRGDADDLTGRTAGDGAGDVGPVAVAVTGGRVGLPRRHEPGVGVVAVATAVLLGERRVAGVDTRVQDGDGDALAAVAVLPPRLRGVHLLQAPGGQGRLTGDLGDLDLLLEPHVRHVVTGRQLVQRGGVDGGADAVDHPQVDGVAGCTGGRSGGALARTAEVGDQRGPLGGSG